MIKKLFGNGRPAMAVFLSGLVAPGIGQIYNRDYKRGALLLLLSIGSFYWFSTVLTEQLSAILPGTPETWVTDATKFREALLAVVQKNPGMFVSFYALMILTWIFAMVDAYISAKKLPLVPPNDPAADPER